MRKTRKRATAGFTLVEVVVAFSISLVVMAVVMTTYVWSLEQTILCTRLSWSQGEALSSKMKLLTYIRNADEIAGIDTNHGTWVQLRFPDGSTSRLTYSNDVPEIRDGRLYLQKDGTSEILIARGLTGIMGTNGFTTPIFFKTRDNALRVAYRVSEPTAAGARAVNDDRYAASVSFAVHLRNAVVE